MSLWSDAFTKSPGPRSVTPDEFERLEQLKLYFGSQPLQSEERGGRVSWNSNAYRFWSAYQMLERDFAGIDESFLSERELNRILDTTGGRPVFWKSKSGTPYMALLDVPFISTPIYRFPDIFGGADRGDPVNDLWMSILRKGGVVAFPKDVEGSADGWDKVSGTVRELNERNIKALVEAGLLTA